MQLGSRGSAVIWAIWPAAISTIIVSPTAREAPSTTAATMPDRAAGNTTRSEVCSRVAPRPNEPSRSDCGTADIASSATDAMVGMTMKPMMIEAESDVEDARPRCWAKSWRMFGVKKVSAK